MRTNKLVSLTLCSLALPAALAVVGCDKKDDGGDKTAQKADAKTDGAKAEAKAEAKADAKPEAEAPEGKNPVEMVEYDLSSADPEWEGWVASGPTGAKVMVDGVKGARIAANGRDAFDLAFAPKHTDLAQLKGNVEKGAEASDGKLTLSFTSDTPELLEWIADGYGAKRYNFVMNFSEGDREVTCKNNIMVGIASEADLEEHKKACRTLAKK